MPGSVTLSSPTTVMPKFLCRLFLHSRRYVTETNGYPDGRRQTRLRSSSSRKSWVLEAAGPPGVLTDLLNFYLSRKGPTEPFFFYDLSIPGVSYDPTGNSTNGRYTVRFASELSETLAPGRLFAEFELVECA